MFNSKKIKTMRDEINQLKNQVSILNGFKDDVMDKEWLEHNPNGALFLKSSSNTGIEMRYKANRTSDGIRLKAMSNDINGYNILERKRIENINGNTFELIVQYGTWKQRDDYVCGDHAYDEVFYESKFLIDFFSNVGIEVSCKEITCKEFKNTRKEL